MVDPEDHPGQAHPPDRHSRSPTESHRPAPGLQVRAALRVRAGSAAEPRNRSCARSTRPITSLPAISRSGPRRARPRSRPTSPASTRRRSRRSASSVRPRSCRSDGWIRIRTPASRRRRAPSGQRPRRRVPRRAQAHHQGGQWDQLRRGAWRDTRARRRVGLWQVHHGQGHPADPATDGRIGEPRRRGPRCARLTRRCGPGARDCR